MTLNLQNIYIKKNKIVYFFSDLYQSQQLNQI
jgi:hypothetical protein